MQYKNEFIDIISFIHLAFITNTLDTIFHFRDFKFIHLTMKNLLKVLVG